MRLVGLVWAWLHMLKRDRGVESGFRVRGLSEVTVLGNYSTRNASNKHRAYSLARCCRGGGGGSSRRCERSP